jgi:uncharacterized tellurite resistance protein B-like protein
MIPASSFLAVSVHGSGLPSWTQRLEQAREGLLAIVLEADGEVRPPERHASSLPTMTSVSSSSSV